MRPVLLEMTAFGPFADTARVDFAALGDGLFLITGPTGAGKTTIFDAICYALYNTGSGEERGGASLRSDYAQPTERTLVRLTFTHQGRSYCVERSPGYMRPKQRGTGLTEVKPTAVLYREPDLPLEDPRQVDQALQNLLHTTYAQFKQLSMLAQGEFRRLLSASTAERTAILREIFSTAPYERMAALLREERALSGQQAEAARQALTTLAAEALPPADAEALAGAVAKAREGALLSALEVPDLLEEANRLDAQEAGGLEALTTRMEQESEHALQALTHAQDINRRLTDRDAKRQQAAALEARQAEIAGTEARLERMRRAVRVLRPLLVERDRAAQAQDAAQLALNEAQRRAGELAQRLQAAQADRQAAETHRAEAEGLRGQATVLAATEGDYTRRDAQQAALKKAGEARAEAEKAMQTDTARLEDLKQRITEAEQEEQRLAAVPDQCSKAALQAQALAALQKSADALCRTQLPEAQTQARQLAKAQKTVQEATAAWSTADQARREAVTHLNANRAGLLAETLCDGQPCPVCGSTAHPRPAQKQLADITEERVSALENEAERLRADLNAAGQQAEVIRVRAQDAQTRCLRALYDLTQASVAQGVAVTVEDTAEFSLAQCEACAGETLAVLNQAWTAAEAEHQRLQREADHLKQLREKLPRQRESAERGQKQVQADREALQRAVADAQAAQAALNALPALPHPTLQAAQTARQQLEERARQLEEAITRCGQNVLEASREVAAATAQAQEKQRLLSESVAAAKAAQETFTEGLTENGFADEAALRVDLVDEAAISATEKELQTYRTALASARQVAEQAERECAGLTRQDVDALSARAQELKRQTAESRKTLGEVQQRLRRNADLLPRLREAVDSQQAAQARRDLVARVCDVVSGNVSGSAKRSLETWAQVRDFERILQSANLRLTQVSGGRFELLRHDDSHDIASRSALDLDIYDRETDKARPVGTLSGGESFKAALSLALGLSDTVTAAAGGISAEALFIDEGFGTLDEVALAEALDMLTSLTVGGRMIGIISHREELRERIPRQLLVTRARRGSKIIFTEG